MSLTLEEKIQRSSQAPAESGAKDCCKRIGSLSVTTDDGERFVGRCPVCACRHFRAFPDLPKVAAP